MASARVCQAARITKKSNSAARAPMVLGPSLSDSLLSKCQAKCIANSSRSQETLCVDCRHPFGETDDKESFGRGLVANHGRDVNYRMVSRLLKHAPGFGGESSRRCCIRHGPQQRLRRSPAPSRKSGRWPTWERTQCQPQSDPVESAE
jgi:hypothetical protein